MTDKIKSAVISAIKPICPNVYFNRSPAVYPKIRVELKRLGNFAPVKKYILYCDFYGKIDDAAALDNITDAVFTAFNDVIGYDADGGTIRAYSADGEQSTVDDTAADIKHITAYIPLRVI